MNYMYVGNPYLNYFHPFKSC